MNANSVNRASITQASFTSMGLVSHRCDPDRHCVNSAIDTPH